MLDAYDKARLSGYTGSREDFQKSEYLSGGIDAARAAGFAGSEDDIQELLIGKARGTLTPYDLAVTYGFRGTAKDWLDSLNGRDGLDAYALAVSKGFDGTADDWLASITGKDGLDAYQLALTNGFEGSLGDWLKNLQGLKGDTGPMPNHRWDGTRLQFQLPDGSYGDLVDLRGAQGKDGADGQDGQDGKIPDHQIDGRRIRFEKPNGEWGQWVELGAGQVVAGMGGGGSLSLQKFFNSVDDFPTPGKTQILYFDKSTTPYGVYVWDGTEYQQVGGGGGVLPEHNELDGRGSDDAHPISSITGLREELDNLGGGAFITGYPDLNPSLLMDFERSVDPRITFTRASSKTRTNSKGVLETVPANVAVRDFDPVTLACKGLFIEEARTNLLRHSNGFNVAGWFSGSGVSISGNAGISPDGTMNADRVVLSGANGHMIDQNLPAPLTVGQPNTISVFIKNESYTGGYQIAYYDGSTTLETASVDLVGTDWQRYTFTFTPTVTAASPRIRLNGFSGGLDGQSYQIYGAQLEQGAFPTSYIPTTTAAATRAADNAIMTGDNFTDWYNPIEGTFLVEVIPGVQIPNPAIVWDVGDGTADNRLRFFRVSSNGGLISCTNNGNTTVSGLNSGDLLSGILNKSATAFKNADLAIVSNAGAVATGNPVVPLVNQIAFGKASHASSNYLNGHIKRIIYWPKRLTDAQLQIISRNT